MPTTITEVNCRYGAPMGRVERHGDIGEDKLYLHRVKLCSGGYDSGGAYWGIGAPLYECFNEAQTFSRYLRARSRDKAKEQIREEYPDAKFFR